MYLVPRCLHTGSSDDYSLRRRRRYLLLVDSSTVLSSTSSHPADQHQRLRILATALLAGYDNASPVVYPGMVKVR